MIDLNKITAYELEEKRDLPEQKATGYRLRHKKTKARVLLIENEDTNKENENINSENEDNNKSE